MRNAGEKRQDKIKIIYTIQSTFVIPFRTTENVANEHDSHRFLINNVNLHIFCTGLCNTNRINILYSDMEKWGKKWEED